MLPENGVPSAVVWTFCKWIAQLDRKRVPQARSSGCKSSVVATAECLPRKSERQLTAESAECCRTRGSNHLSSRGAPARTATGEPDMLLDMLSDG